MFKNWVAVFVVSFFALFLGWVVSAYGDCLLVAPWGNVAINVISDFFFVVGLAVLFGLPYLIMTSKVRKFFGIGPQNLIQIYVSSHEDPTTSTRKVMTAEEHEVAEELKSILQKQFPSFVPSLAKLFGIDLGTLDIPDIVIRSSPLEVDEWPYSGSLILVGGPTRNKLTEYHLTSSNPWLTFDDDSKQFVEWERRGQPSSKKELDNSHKLAIVERLIVDEKVIIIAFGYGEVGTAAAVRYLAQNWSGLTKKNQEFARLLQVDGPGQVQVLEQYP